MLDNRGFDVKGLVCLFVCFKVLCLFVFSEGSRSRLCAHSGLEKSCVCNLLFDRVEVGVFGKFRPLW